ncbi:MAG: hypothetical protein V1816_12405, partial [Pseudomonadota bacterium]
MAGSDDLEVTNILDPDLGFEDLNIKETDIDLELEGALGDPSLSGGDDDIFNLDDLLSDNNETTPTSTGTEDNLNLDDDQLDFDLGDALDEKPAAPAKREIAGVGLASPDDEEIDFELDDASDDEDETLAGDEAIDFELGGSLEDEEELDFELDQPLPAPQALAGDEALDFDLKNALEDEEELDFELDQPLAAPEALAGDEALDFDLKNAL